MLLPYANAKLHLGHILGYTQSDIWTPLSEYERPQLLLYLW